MNTFKEIEGYRTSKLIYYRVWDYSQEFFKCEDCLICGLPIEDSDSTFAHQDCWGQTTNSAQDFICDAAEHARKDGYPSVIIDLSMLEKLTDRDYETNQNEWCYNPLNPNHISYEEEEEEWDEDEYSDQDDGEYFDDGRLL